jgi:hypothetical protein
MPVLDDDLTVSVMKRQECNPLDSAVMLDDLRLG